MPRFIAIEWDNREARIAVASTKGSGVQVEHLLAAPLPTRDKEAEEGKPADPQVGQTIGAALDAAGIRRDDCLVSIGRASVELKQLSFPPVPPEELPDMVRLQAMREFHSLGEDWPLDYLPLTSTTDGNRTVLAAAFSPDVLKQFQETCQKASLEAKKMVLRPVAATSLFLRSEHAQQEEVRLLIDLVSEEVHLTVLVGRDPVFMRTARLPHDAIQSLDNLKAPFPELRRTLAAANNQLGGRKVQAIYLSGTPEEHGDLARRIEAELGMPVRVFNPLEGLQLSSALKANRPTNSGRFAPLLGMLSDELLGVPHGIDFLHPHRPPEPPSKRNTYLLAAAVACAAVLLVAIVIWQQLASLDRKIEELAKTSKGLDPVVKSAKDLEKAAGEIKQWTDNDIVWLEELRQLSERFPESKEAMLTHLRLSPHPDGGSMVLEGLVRESSTIEDLEKALRDDFHSVKGDSRQHERDNKKYSWQFKSAVTVKPQDYKGEGKAKPATAARAESAKR